MHTMTTGPPFLYRADFCCAVFCGSLRFLPTKFLKKHWNSFTPYSSTLRQPSSSPFTDRFRNGSILFRLAKRFQMEIRSLAFYDIDWCGIKYRATFLIQPCRNSLKNVWEMLIRHFRRRGCLLRCIFNIKWVEMEYYNLLFLFSTKINT